MFKKKYYFDCMDPILPRHNSNIGRTNDVYATALMWIGNLFKFLIITPSMAGHLFKFLLITHSVC